MLTAQENRFALSDLAVGKKYIVTLIAYRGTKRSRVVETSFSTGNILSTIFLNLHIYETPSV